VTSASCADRAEVLLRRRKAAALSRAAVLPGLMGAYSLAPQGGQVGWVARAFLRIGRFTRPTRPARQPDQVANRHTALPRKRPASGHGSTCCLYAARSIGRMARPAPLETGLTLLNPAVSGTLLLGPQAPQCGPLCGERAGPPP